ncbi:MAG: (2Fe-2S)-binding protein [Spirochaetes bacterium]|nr:(2Fe-2S)-binding protein [Spirochaetota bacterium]
MIICSCANVNDKQVKNALASGARTLADLQQNLGVTMQCGRCREAVFEEIARFHGAADTVPVYPQGTLAPQP